MNIVLEYDPVTLHATLEQNGIAGSELFGPLSNVSGYPIQSWLEKRGAWPGLTRILSDIGRGRALNVTFIGRGIDYQDVICALSGMKEASITFRNAHEIPPIDHGIPDSLKRLMSDYPSAVVRGQLDELLERAAPAEYIRIETTEEYRKHERELENTRTVIIMLPAVFRAIRSDLLSRLREHFMRPCESIVLLARDPREQNALAEEFGGMGISVCTEVSSLIGELIEKHSLPEIAQFYSRLYEKLILHLSMLDSRCDRLAAENRLLRKQNLDSGHADERQYAENLKEIKWLKAHRPQIDELLCRLNNR